MTGFSPKYEPPRFLPRERVETPRGPGVVESEQGRTADVRLCSTGRVVPFGFFEISRLR